MTTLKNTISAFAVLATLTTASAEAQIGGGAGGAGTSGGSAGSQSPPTVSHEDVRPDELPAGVKYFIYSGHTRFAPVMLLGSGYTPEAGGSLTSHDITGVAQSGLRLFIALETGDNFEIDMNGDAQSKAGATLKQGITSQSAVLTPAGVDPDGSVLNGGNAGIEVVTVYPNGAQNVDVAPIS